MAFSKLLKEFFYSLSATDKYSDFDSRKSFNRVNKPTAQTSLLYSHQNNSSSVSLTSPSTDSSEGVHETRLAWRHIKKWLHKHSQDLNSTLLSPCTESDLSEFQKDLNIRLPKCVQEFFTMTDGQSTFNENGSGGLIYGLRLMSINEIAVMTESWRKVHKAILEQQNVPVLEPQLPVVEETSDLGEPSKLKQPKVKNERANPFPRQYCVPPGSILPIYAHSMWIPIITDGVGNCIAVDLSLSVNEASIASLSGTPRTSEAEVDAEHSSETANISVDVIPGESITDKKILKQEKTDQTWGQVIIFGRDFDTKFKIADNFGDFLLIFANDLEKGNWELTSSSDNEDLMCGSDTELIYVDHETRREMPYLDVLKRRVTDQWLNSLSEEQKALKDNKKLIDLLHKGMSIQVPELSETTTDNLINENLCKIDVINTPIKSGDGVGAAGGPSHSNDFRGDLDDDMT